MQLKNFTGIYMDLFKEAYISVFLPTDYRVAAIADRMSD